MSRYNLRIHCLFLFSHRSSQSIAVADQNQALPEHAIRVLGNDDYVFPAQCSVSGSDRVLATDRGNAAIIDVESGAVLDLASLVRKR